MKTLTRLDGCPGLSKSSLGTQVILLVLLWCDLYTVATHNFSEQGSKCATWYNDWAASRQNQQNHCAPCEDSDQPGHPPSLIRVFAVHMKKAWVLSYPLSTQRRLWSDWADAQADPSLRWEHSHFVGFVISRLNYFPALWGKTDDLIIQLGCKKPQYNVIRKSLPYPSSDNFWKCQNWSSIWRYC